MKRIYKPYTEWECFPAGFFKSINDLNKTEQTELCVQLYSDSASFEVALKNVIKHWPNSCLHNLSNLDSNRIAWLGQACCAITYGICKDISGPAFNQISENKQKKANLLAEKYLKIWESQYNV